MTAGVKQISQLGIGPIADLAEMAAKQPPQEWCTSKPQSRSFDEPIKCFLCNSRHARIVHKTRVQKHYAIQDRPTPCTTPGRSRDGMTCRDGPLARFALGQKHPDGAEVRCSISLGHIPPIDHGRDASVDDEDISWVRIALNPSWQSIIRGSQGIGPNRPNSGVDEVGLSNQVRRTVFKYLDAVGKRDAAIRIPRRIHWSGPVQGQKEIGENLALIGVGR
jgi:hypothetical protein